MREFGARPFRASNVRRSTLKSILLLIGSQCREASTGEICSYFFVLASVQAAALLLVGYESLVSCCYIRKEEHCRHLVINA